MKKQLPVLITLLLILSLILPPPLVAAANDGNIIVRIRYIFDDLDQSKAADLYEANVPLSYDKVETVPSPEVKGYKPDQESVTLNFKEYTEDTEFLVVYRPLTVPYQVEHWVENPSKDAFILKETESLSAKVGETVTASPKALEGFSPITPYQTEKVPAEGTLNLIVKYTRNVYTLSYDTDGGSYIPSEQHAFEDSLRKPLDPVKAGYTFGGWEPLLPAAMPASDLELKAKWLEDAAPYKYAYLLQNANDDDYTLIGYSDETGETNSPVIIPVDGAGPAHISFFPVKNYAGFTFNDPKYFGKYFVFNQQKTLEENNGKKISGDGNTIVPLYFTRREYTIVFGNSPDYFNDQSAYFPEITKGGTTYTRDNLYKITVRYGQDFSDLIPYEDDISNLPDGQHLTGMLYVKGSGYGSWMTKKPPYRFNEHMAFLAPQTVVDLSEDANFPYTQYIALIVTQANNKLEIYEHFQKLDGTYDELTKPTRTEGLDGGAWYYSGAAYKGFLNDSGYMDYYEHKDGKRDSSFLIRRNGKPSLSKGDKLLNPDGTVKEEITTDWDRNADGVVNVYLARKSFPIRFYIDPDKESTDLAKKLLYEAPISPAIPSIDVINSKKPKNIPTEYEFKGWYTDKLYQNKLDDHAVMGAEPIILFAKWGAPEGDITVTVKPDNGSPDSSLHPSYNGQITKEQLGGDPKKPGYVFTGWYLEEENGSANQLYDFSMRLTRDITILAKYRAATSAGVTVRYLDESGNAVAAEKSFPDLGVGLDYTYESVLVEGMLPDSLSKKITVNANPDQNILVFHYKPFTTVDYTVRYVTRSLDAEGNIQDQDIAPSESVTTNRSIDTRNYREFAGYMPLTLKQTLRLSQNPEDNVMTFVYKSVDPNTSAYTIQYYFSTDREGNYELDESRNIVLSGKIGETVTLNEIYMPPYLNGYRFNAEKSQKSGVITSFDSLILKLYYDREAQPGPAPEPGPSPDGHETLPSPSHGQYEGLPSPGMSASPQPGTVVIRTNPTTAATSPSQGQEAAPAQTDPAKVLPRTGEDSTAPVTLRLLLMAAALGLVVIILKKKSSSDGAVSEK